MSLTWIWPFDEGGVEEEGGEAGFIIKFLAGGGGCMMNMGA